MEQKKDLKVGVKTLIFSSLGNFLFLKRNTSFYKEGSFLLDIPGGRINENEGLIQNLKREVSEETGIEDLDTLAVLGAQDIETRDAHVVRITYVSRVTSEKVVLSDEHESFEWINIKDLTQRLKDIDPLVSKIIKDKMSYIKDILNTYGKTQ